MSAQTHFETVRARFRDAGDPAVAQGQMAYMKNHFEFYGLKMPVWRDLARQLHQELGIPAGEDLHELARLCFADEHRELHYYALQTLEKALKKQPAGFIDLLEELILTNSWWDSVDWIAKLVGLHFKRYPELIGPVTARWMDSGALWLQRVCLIFQLTYKEKTDSAMLFGFVRRVALSKEFFLQKGAGWALRQYARTNPEAVRAFVEREKLAPLTRREAMKHL